MSKVKLTEKDLINKWLTDYHNTNVDKVLKDNPDWDIESKEWDSNTFYNKYLVTKEQHDEWEKWARNEVYESSSYTKEYVNKHFGFIALNCAPKIKND